MSEKQAEKEAMRQAVLFEEECKGGATTSAVKFDVFFTQWFDEHAKIKIKAKTMQTYRWLEKRIRAEFGHLRLDKITTRDIQRLVVKLHYEKQSTKTVKLLCILNFDSFPLRYQKSDGFKKPLCRR